MVSFENRENKWYVVFAYKLQRQLNNNPYVIVHVYCFHNYDREHTLTLSYRLSEENYWKSDFAKILNSFRITNIKNK